MIQVELWQLITCGGTAGIIVLILGCYAIYNRHMLEASNMEIDDLKSRRHISYTVQQVEEYKNRIKFLEEKVADMEAGRDLREGPMDLTPGQIEMMDNKALLAPEGKSDGE